VLSSQGWSKKIQWTLLGLVLVFSLTMTTAKALAADTGRKNLVIVTLDTFRRDRLAVYGGAGLTPYIDAFFDCATVFDDAATPVPLTLPAHVSLMTGLLPFEHGVRDNDQSLSTSTVLLAEVLKRAGYDTAAFVSSNRLSSKFGIGRGFDDFSESWNPDTLEVDAATTVTSVLSYLSGRPRSGKPLFLWVHFYDAHWPYSPPGQTISEGMEGYDREIAFVDRQVGRLLDSMSSGLPAESTTVVIAADHGESLGEHGEQTHGFMLFESTVRIPLAIRSPGLVPGHVTIPTTLADVPAILGTLLGFLAPGGGFAIDSLSLALAGGRTNSFHYLETLHPPMTFGWPASIAVRTRDAKMIAGPESLAFDLEADPQETRNVAGEPAIAPQLDRSLRWAVGASGVRTLRKKLPAHVPNDLQGLGYLNPDGGSENPPTDQKTYVKSVQKAERILCNTLLGRELVHRREFGGAEAFLEKALAENPAFPGARFWWATGRMRRGDLHAAAEEFRSILRSEPQDSWSLYNLSTLLLFTSGGAGEAESGFRKLISARDGWVEAHVGLATSLRIQGKMEEAEREYRSILVLDPSNRFALDALRPLPTP